MKSFIYIVFVLLFLLVTFFGMGPVLMADGSSQERIITFLIVLLIYVFLYFAMKFILKKFVK